MLAERLDEHDVRAWLVNTGWTGGPYGTGERMNINHTRSMVRAALSGALDGVATEIDPIFGVEVPLTCPDVPDEVLQPRATWADGDAYDRQAAALARMFVENFAAYADGVSEAVRSAGPRVVDDAPRTQEGRTRRGLNADGAATRRAARGLRRGSSGRNRSGLRRPSATAAPRRASVPRTRTTGATTITAARISAKSMVGLRLDGVVSARTPRDIVRAPPGVAWATEATIAAALRNSATARSRGVGEGEDEEFGERHVDGLP